MRLNVNRLLHTPDASQEVRFEMDLSQLDFGGAAPITRPVTVEGRIRNQAGVLLCQLEMHTTLHCVCDRCMEEFDAPKSVSYSCVLARRSRRRTATRSSCWSTTRWIWRNWPEMRSFSTWTRKLFAPRTVRVFARLRREPQPGALRCKKQVDPRLAKLASLLQEKE